jgi:peptidoglycan hydrolase-like protein with peptidoglycan-binding domain
MSYSLLRIGSSGPQVSRLQTALNEKLKPSPKLKPDGKYGSLTMAAVRAFQTANWLVVAGEAGPCTQAALFGTEAYPPLLYPIARIGQPTPSSCWAAATAMMTNSTVAAVKAKTPSDMWAEPGGLYNSSESDQAIVTGTRFGRVHGLTCNAPMSYTLAALRAKLARGPLMFDMLWEASKYVEGKGSPGHMIVVIGMRGDNDPSGRGTTLRINDPWPVPMGQTYSVGFLKWISEVPTRTYRVFEK